MKKTVMLSSSLPVIVALLATGTVGSSSCKKEDEPAPAPSAAPPPPAPAPTPVVVAPEEDAGIVVEDVVPDVKKVGKAVPADVAGLRACCTALQQNAASMPPPNNAYALQAAAMCQSLVAGLASGSTSKSGALGAIGSAMRGANLPAACK